MSLFSESHSLNFQNIFCLHKLLTCIHGICHPRRLFVKDPESGLTLFETMLGITAANRDRIRLPFYVLGTEKTFLKQKDKDGNPKIWRIKTLTNDKRDWNDWLDAFEEQLMDSWDYYWTMRAQAKYQRERKLDGQSGWFPMDAIIIWRDFALNFKRFASRLRQRRVNEHDCDDAEQ